VREQSQVIGEFLEWLECSKNLVICCSTNYTVDVGGYVPCGKSANDLLYDYFRIDPGEYEAEKQKMLTELRS